jgi:TolB protein
LWLAGAISLAAVSCQTPTDNDQESVSTILFYSQRSTGEGFYLVSPDGLRVTPFSVPGLKVDQYVRDFDWSPGGSHIAFADNSLGDGYASNYPQVYIVDVPGGNRRQVTSSPGGSDHPSWSPDGSMLLYWSFDNVPPSLSLVRADGSRPRTLPATEGASLSRPSWSPDGKRIVFARDEIRLDPATGENVVTTSLFVTDIDGSTATRLTTAEMCGDRDPAWSPDGTTIAFVGCRGAIRGIYVMTADGSDPRRVISAIDNTALLPAWSPAGDRLVFEGGPRENRDIFSINLDGTNVVNLTADNPLFDGAPKWRRP